MSVNVSTTNKPLNPRAQDLSPKGYNRAALYSGKALDFDGVNDVVLSTITISGAKTYCAWINADGTSNERIISISTGGFSNTTFSNNKFAMYDGTNIPETTTTFETDQWYFVVAVQEANNAKIYVNGISQPLNTTNWIEHTYTSATIAIGRDVATSAWFDGEISGVRVFNTALTAAQVADLYLNPEKIVPDGVADSALKLWLPMMEGAGTTAYDGSGNGNHGTINGATWVSGVGAPVAQTALVSWNKGVNSFTYSEQFDNAAWTKVSTTITANSIVSPDGYQNADKAEAFSSSQLISQTPSLTAGQPFVFSVFAKAGNWGIIRIGNQASGTNGAWFNLNTGTAGTINGGTSEIIDYGNGWFRLIAKFSSFVSGQSFIGISDADGSTATPAVGSNLYLWGASLTQSSSVQPYIPTLATTQTSPVLLPQGLTANKDITGVNAFESARNPYALNLDGASWGEVHDNASVDLTDGISLECWYYNDGASDKGLFGRYFSGNTSFLLYAANTANSVEFFTNTSSSLKTNLSSGWHHLLGTYDGANRKLYVDGVLEDTDAYTTDMGTNDKPIEIGRYFGASAKAYTNQIALPRIYNRALTATEVARNYNADRSKFGL